MDPHVYTYDTVLLLITLPTFIEKEFALEASKDKLATLRQMAELR